jgi:hypothetical protein
VYNSFLPWTQVWLTLLLEWYTFNMYRTSGEILFSYWHQKKYAKIQLPNNEEYQYFNYLQDDNNCSLQLKTHLGRDKIVCLLKVVTMCLVLFRNIQKRFYETFQDSKVVILNRNLTFLSVLVENITILNYPIYNI